MNCPRSCICTKGHRKPCMFPLLNYSYDISDHTSSPFFSRDCNGKESNAIPAVSGQSLGGVEPRMER
ncbi:hypothetical protein Q8A67_019608 [Cirrhinus molitorella]|uniref:Uncharacterized protein n=1 Tax=Cirrhinus molitorella TaxID=172907 RepID=A0AA88TI41_9TELE|nr:hypothetical protein Q8A67_019608 [Cirrhinus molitorella]